MNRAQRRHGGVSRHPAVEAAFKLLREKKMPLASGYTHKKDIPNEPGEWMEFRELGFADAKAARDERRRQSAKELQDLGPDLYGVMIRQNGAKSIIDPVNTHDVLTLLDRGLVSWSYNPSLPPREPGHIEARRQLLGQLGESTATWAARQVMELAGVDNAWGEDDGVIDVEAEVRRLPEVSRNSSYASIDA